MRVDNDDTLRKVLHSDHNGPLKRSVSYKISFGFSPRRSGVSQALLMNKLRLYINLLIVIQIGFLNRRLEVMSRLGFLSSDVLWLTNVYLPVFSETENCFQLLNNV